MGLKELKQELGRDLVFWGGEVDKQGVLGTGTPAEVKEDVKRNIEALAPGGGFVFAAVHDIQAIMSRRKISSPCGQPGNATEFTDSPKVRATGIQRQSEL
jgi:hypothetical protein